MELGPKLESNLLRWIKYPCISRTLRNHRKERFDKFLGPKDV